MLSVYSVCAVTANPNSWSSSTDFSIWWKPFSIASIYVFYPLEAPQFLTDMTGDAAS